MHKFFMSSATALMLFVAFDSSAAPAEDKNSRWYQIDVVVFSYANNTKNHEIWRPVGQNSEMADAAEILYPPEIAAMTAESKPDKYVQGVPTPQSGLVEVAERLAASPEYHLLLHKAWIQQVDRDVDPMPVMINDQTVDPQTMGYQSEEEIQWEQATVKSGATQPLVPAPSPSGDAEKLLQQAMKAEEQQSKAGEAEEIAVDPVLNSIPVTKVGPSTNLVFGTVGVKWSRYLHLMVDVTYRRNTTKTAGRISDDNLKGLAFADAGVKLPPEPLTKLMTPAIADYRIQDSRRLRSNQVYFFDHPLFGVLAKVTAYEKAPAKPAPKVDTTPKASRALGGR
ncbi:MAG: peptidoglycan binding protein CsiV [Gammaproteobacteria bacterium]|nr:peptidoglycan binding protein CsiV [Gammaproteobacteria bacterium]